MSTLVTLAEFFESKGFSPKEAVEKAEKQIREERESEKIREERESEKIREERKHALEFRKMEHEEIMKGISCHCSSVSCILMI
jgi:hypothetical protein